MCCSPTSPRNRTRHGDLPPGGGRRTEGRRRLLRHPGGGELPGLLIDRAVAEFGGIDVLVNNAAYQMSQPDGIEAITTQQRFDRVVRTNPTACSG